MNNPYEKLVTEFIKTFDQKIYDMLSFVPGKVLELRANLIEEEASEYLAATSPVEILDACCDMVYVLVGTAVITNLPTRVKPKDFVILDPLLKPPLVEVPTVIDELCLNIPCHMKLQANLNAALAEVAGIAINVYHFNFWRAFEAVHANNMSKLWGSYPQDPELVVIPKNGAYLVKRKSDGKVIKPPGHQIVDLSPFV